MLPSPSHELIRPLDGESPGLEAAPTEQNALRATRRLIARIKCEACGGVRQATVWHVLNAEDAQIIEEDSDAQQERDLTLFQRWHQGRGTDPGVALEELKQRTGGQARNLVEKHKRDREASPEPFEQLELEPR